MRKPKHLSFSALRLFESDREQFVMERLAEVRAPREPQGMAAAVGSGFDAKVKAELGEALFGKGWNPEFEFDNLFVEQVDSHHRDWALPASLFTFDRYIESGAYDDLLAMLQKAKEPPQFEFTAMATVHGVPLLGKPDCRFIHEAGFAVILDWKVMGFASKSGTSPTKYYQLCRDGYTAEKQSRSHGCAHKGYVPLDYHGFEINTSSMEDAKPMYADQISIYSWVSGGEVGDDVVAAIDELVCRPGEEFPLIRVSNLRARIAMVYQYALLHRIMACWEAIDSGHIFKDLSREESDAKCHRLSEIALMRNTDGSDDDTSAIKMTQKQFRG